MKEILFRLGQVAWWFGALCASAATVATAFIRNMGERAAVVGGAWLFVTLPCFAVAFVLTGSFWKPAAKT
jgi:hypothetical protein